MKDNTQKKGFKVIVYMVVLLVFGSISVFSQDCGDVNNGGSTDIIDALLIAQYYVGIIPAVFITEVADVNSDGSVNIIDALLVAQYYVGLITELSCPNDTPTPVTTPDVTIEPGEVYTGNTTWFTALGSPYGGCGIPQEYLDSPHFVALNVQNSPGDYTTFHPRPIPPEYASVIGMFNNGLNCGRWVRVTIGDYCDGINDGAPGMPFCRDGAGYVSDAYNGATLDMLISDSCYDSNSWCRDDPYHIDVAKDSINQFILNDQPVGDLEPLHYNNRQMHWQFIEAPDYTGDIRIGFMQGAMAYWCAIAITHLRNGIHGVDYYDGASWVKAEMNSDMGQSYIISPLVEGGTEYRIRVYDVTDQLINDGRIYNFIYPESCEYQCSTAYTEVPYTTE